MTAPLVFADTETLGLDLYDPIWEIGMIRHDTDPATGTVTERVLHLFVDHDPARRAGLPDRFRDDLEARYDPTVAVDTVTAAKVVHSFTAGAHLVGAVPSFDTNRLELMMRPLGLRPSWHYHIICAEVLAVGCLADEIRTCSPERAAEIANVIGDLPWRSDDLSALLGVTVAEEERHTALGDARWAQRIYMAVMGLAE